MWQEMSYNKYKSGNQRLFYESSNEFEYSNDDIDLANIYIEQEEGDNE